MQTHVHKQERTGVPGATLMLAGISVALALIPIEAAEVFFYARTAIAGGEWWRLLSAHLMHWSWSHLFYDLLVFVVLGCWCETRSSVLTRRVYWISAPLISLLLIASCPQLTYYAGLSGIVAAQIGLAAWLAWTGKDVWERIILVFITMIFCMKIYWEFSSGGSMFADMPVRSFPLAHVFGLLCGLLIPPLIKGGVHRRSRIELATIK